MPDDAPTDEPASETPSDAGAPPSPDGETTPGGYSYTLVDDSDAAATGAAPGSSPRRGLLLLALVAAAIVPAAIVGTVVWFVASSGGGSDTPRLGADVANVINAFSQGEAGALTTRYEGQSPPGLPADLPTYPGAKVVSSIAQVRGDDVSYLVVYDTRDARDNVAAHFSGALGADPWQIDGGQDGGESTLHQFSKIDDANVAGLVLVAESKDDELTTIIESVQIISGAKDRKPTPVAARDSRPLPVGFPGDVPSYGGATLIESAYQKKAGAQSFAVSFITKDAASGVLDFYRDELGSAKLNVTDGDASQSGLEDAEAIQFSDDKSQLAGAIVVGKFAEDAAYTRIDVQVRVAKAAPTP